ncbi:MAG: ABC transporter permease [Rhodothermales bacterium]|nr:ABC transporter permease [Rhodothermales bacterium]
MKHVFESFVAMRYVSDRAGRREGRGFVRFVTGVGVGGVAVGVAALLLALSIVHGFSREITAKIEGLGAHVQIESQTDAPLRNVAAIAEDVSGIGGVVGVRRVVENFVLLRRSATQVDGVVLSGVEQLPPFLVDRLVAGGEDLEGGAGVIIGKTLADLQNITVGDRITVFAFSGRGSGSVAVTKPRVKQFHVVGIYETSLDDFDEIYVFADLGTVAGLIDYAPNSVTRLDVTVDPEADRTNVVEAIEAKYGFPVMVKPIEEVHRSLFAWVELQESIIPVVIGFIVLVAVFNIGGILLMMVMEKTRSLGILVSMGANRKSVRNLVLTLAGVIGLVGITIGELLALLLAFLQKRFDLIPLPADAYYMKTAPIELNPVDFIVVAVVTLLLCVAFAYIPARIASKLDPIRVIRFH